MHRVSALALGVGMDTDDGIDLATLRIVTEVWSQAADADGTVRHELINQSFGK